MTARTHEIAQGVHWLPLRGANAYLVRSGGSWTLVDAGYARSRATIAEAAGRLCGTAGRPEAIVLTHGHPDHAGAASGLATAWDAPILVSAAELPFVDGSALYPEPLVAWLRRVLPQRSMDRLTRGADLGPSLRPFETGAGVPGLPDWEAVATPGHTPGHLALFRPADRTLLCGDAVLTIVFPSRLGGGGLHRLRELLRGAPRLSGPPPVVTCDRRDAAASIARLAELRPWVLASGHGRPLCGARVAPALRAFADHVASRARH